MRLVKLRRHGKRLAITIPKEYELDGYVPGALVRVTSHAHGVLALTLIREDDGRSLMRSHDDEDG